MKKLLLLPLVACVICCTSCKKDENEKTYNADGNKAKPTMEYTVLLNDTVLHFFHVTLSYRGADCQTHSLELKDQAWSLTENGWGDSLGLRMQFSLKEGVDTAYNSTDYIHDSLVDLRIVTQVKAVKTNPDGSMSAFHGDFKPSIWEASGTRLKKAHFTGILDMLNRRYSHNFTPLQ